VCEAISERNRSWPREHPCQHDEAVLKRGIAPSLDAHSLEKIVDATSLLPAAFFM
jgi:hypothetical protein